MCYLGKRKGEDRSLTLLLTGAHSKSSFNDPFIELVNQAAGILPVLMEDTPVNNTDTVLKN